MGHSGRDADTVAEALLTKAVMRLGAELQAVRQRLAARASW